MDPLDLPDLGRPSRTVSFRYDWGPVCVPGGSSHTEPLEVLTWRCRVWEYLRQFQQLDRQGVD